MTSSSSEMLPHRGHVSSTCLCAAADVSHRTWTINIITLRPRPNSASSFGCYSFLKQPSRAESKPQAISQPEAQKVTSQSLTNACFEHRELELPVGVRSGDSLWEFGVVVRCSSLVVFHGALSSFPNIHSQDITIRNHRT